jgi:hypothetical protein
MKKYWVRFNNHPLLKHLIKTLHKNRAGGVDQGEGPELKPQYHKK